MAKTQRSSFVRTDLHEVPGNGLPFHSFYSSREHPRVLTKQAIFFAGLEVDYSVHHLSVEDTRATQL